MERTKQYPCGRCERCGAEGSARDDLTDPHPKCDYDRLCALCRHKCIDSYKPKSTKLRTCLLMHDDAITCKLCSNDH